MAVVTNLFPVLLLFGFMGYAGITLNTATVMVAAIAIGISVDHSMHLMVRYHRNTAESGDTVLALETTIKEEATPIGATAIALMFGFSAMALSSIPPVAQFGLLGALVMILALLSTVVVMPILLSSTRLVSAWDKLPIHRKENFTRPVKPACWTGWTGWTGYSRPQR